MTFKKSPKNSVTYLLLFVSKSRQSTKSFHKYEKIYTYIKKSSVLIEYRYSLYNVKRNQLKVCIWCACSLLTILCYRAIWRDFFGRKNLVKYMHMYLYEHMLGLNFSWSRYWIIYFVNLFGKLSIFSFSFLNIHQIKIGL